jgi:hypothetical protein
MSDYRSFLQKTDAEVLASAETVCSECTANSVEWQIDADKLDSITVVVTNARAAYDANSNKATKNAVTVANKNAAFGELKHFIGTFIDYLELNLHVPDAALAYMGLRPRQHHVHEPLPRPVEELTLSVRKQHDEITVYAARPEHGHPDSSVTAPPYHGFALRYRIEGETVEKSVFSTRVHYTLFFDRADEGKRIFLSGAWINPRLETGPWSVEISEIIG